MTAYDRKLRELLEECRSSAFDAKEYSLCDRIDAALAEPVEGGGCLRCYALGELRVSDQRKNDEAQAEIRNVYAELRAARAEVERFKKAIHTRACQNQSAYNLECVCGADEHQRDLQRLAYQRGAEAMREAAAREMTRLLTERKATAIWVGPDEIHALPIPENKP